MKISKKSWRQVSQILMASSVIGIVLAGVGYTGADIWLASTQWLLVSAVFGMFGIYTKMNA